VFLEGYESTIRLVFFFCLALVVIILIDAFWVGYQFSQNKIRFIFTIKFLRGISDIVIGPLYIPIVAVFTMQLPCVEGDTMCWSSSSHIAIAVIAIIVGVLYIALTVTLVGSYYSRDPISMSPLSRPISRVMMAQLFLKTLLTITFILLHNFDSAKWFLVVLLIIGSFGLAYLYTMQLPYFHFEFNVIRVCTFWVLSWASVCLAIVQFSGDDEQSKSLSILFLVGVPFVTTAAWMATRYRRLMIMNRHHSEMENPTEIELKVRFMLEATTESRIQRAAGLGGSVTKPVEKGKAAPEPVKAAGKPPLIRSDTKLEITTAAKRELDAAVSFRARQRKLEMMEEENRVLEEANMLQLVHILCCSNFLC
jgi:hypothetical protein